MPEEAWRLLEATLTPLAAGVLAWRAARWRPRPRSRCPGRRTRLWPLNPGRWLLRAGCRYDLAGLRADTLGRVTCPECGRSVGPRQRVGAGGRVRVGALAAGVLALCLGGVALHAASGRGLASCLPTLALVALREGPPRLNARPLREELWWRVGDGGIDPWTARVLARSLARDLRADDRPGNALGAEDMLGALWPASRPALEAALVSGDAQARVIAGSILRRRLAGAPSEALLRACVEDLRLRAPDLDSSVGRHRVSQAAEFLVAHAALAEPLIDAALGSPDPQQRLVAAGVAGFAGLERLLPRAAPILVGHLRDNDIAGDAKIAAPALYRFGPAVTPYLHPYLDDADAQRRGLARAILESLGAPGLAAWRMRNRPPPITEVTGDPIRGLRLGSGISDLSWPRERSSARAP